MKLKVLAVLAITGTMFISCNEEKVMDNEITKSESFVSKTDNGTVTFSERMFKFSTLKAFEDFSNKLINEESFRKLIMEKYGKNLMINKLNSTDLSAKQRHIIDNVPSQYLYIINTEGEYQLDDKYFVFGRMAQYVVDINKKDQFDWSNEENIDNSKLKAYRYGRRQNLINISVANARLDIGLNQKHTGGEQHEFTQSTPVSGKRKWVDEIDALDIYKGTALDPARPWDVNNYYDKWECVLVFKAKLEWKGSSWKPASDYRAITPNINYSLSIGPDPSNVRTVATNANIGLACCVSGQPVTEYGTTDWQREVHFTYVDTFGTHGSSKWYLTGSGTIKHEVVGDIPSNTWLRSFGW